MSTARAKTAAVCIPGEGVLVVGGAFIYQWKIWRLFYRGTEEQRFSNKAKMLVGNINGKGEQKWYWLNLPSMINERLKPGIAYFNRYVFVAGGNTGGHIDVERMQYPTGANTKPQWTIVSLMQFPPFNPYSLVIYNHRMFLICG